MKIAFKNGGFVDIWALGTLEVNFDLFTDEVDYYTTEGIKDVRVKLRDKNGTLQLDKEMDEKQETKQRQV
jgi:hypothetical protein